MAKAFFNMSRSCLKPSFSFFSFLSSSSSGFNFPIPGVDSHIIPTKNPTLIQIIILFVLQ